MASIEEFINKTASNVNAGIKGKVEDGSFNRLGEGLSEGVNGIAEGVINFIGMTKEAFGKLNEKASSIGKKPQVTPPPSPQQAPPADMMQQTPPPAPSTEAVEANVTIESQDESVVFCAKCGQKNPADASFCCACGSPIQQTE